MATVQVKDVPEALLRRLRTLARRHGRTLRDLVLDAIRREVDRDQFAARLRSRRSVGLSQRAVDALDEARAERDDDLDR